MALNQTQRLFTGEVQYLYTWPTRSCVETVIIKNFLFVSVAIQGLVNAVNCGAVTQFISDELMS